MIFDEFVELARVTAADRSDCSIGARVLRTEAEGLLKLADSLDGAFSDAVTLLFGVSGRVIVTGMGKSGHVARKIAATLASTGTPSIFVHPSEASHGDLGMVTSNDAVVVLSSSGETSELSDLIAYTRRLRIPLIAVTRKPNSLLARESEVVLRLPDSPEACPLGLAPTTSTTLMLALGDALAVSLLERRGFSASDFRVFHPGGSLGQRLLRVGDLMHGGDAMPLINVDGHMDEAIITMSAKSFGCVGVLDSEGSLIGVVTDGDLRRHLSGNLLSRSVAEVMTRSPKVTTPDALAAEALATMNDYGITSLFALEGGKPVGVLHVHDCLHAGIV